MVAKPEDTEDGPAAPGPGGDAVPGARPRPPRPSRLHRLQNRLVAIAIVAEAIALLGHPVFGWFTTYFAVTPAPLAYTPPVPMTGEQVLVAVSARATLQPNPVSSSGEPYAYVKREDWSLSVGGRRPSAIALAPTATESCLRADGTGRIERMTPTPRRPRLSVGNAGGHPLPDLRLPTASRGPSGDPARTFLALVGLAESQPVVGRSEAQILSDLARMAGVENRGTVLDRVGRPGLAVSAGSSSPGPRMSVTLIFDAQTGALLECDQELLDDSGTLHARAGSVVAYTVFLRAARVIAPGVRP